MIVISDTGPLNYLLAIGEENCLVQLFSKVVIPSSVLIELQKPGAPQRNMDWATCLPANFSVSTARKLDATLDLGYGEREAISLADELHPSALLIDEKRARRIARQRGWAVIGTIGVLERASALRLLDGEKALIALSKTNFHASKEVLGAAISRVRAFGAAR